MFLLDEYYSNLNFLKKKYRKLLTNNFLSINELERYSKQKESKMFFDLDNLILLCEDSDVQRVYFSTQSFKNFLSAVAVLRKQIKGVAVLEYISKEMFTQNEINNFKAEGIKLYAVLNKWQTGNLKFYDQLDDETLTFNVASHQDLDGIRELLVSSFDKFVSHLPNSDMLQKLIYEDLIYCCYYKETIVGVICFERIGTNGLYLYQIAISPILKGTGVGYKLAQFAYRRFPGYKVFTSWVEENNLMSENLHRKLGFEKMSLKTMVFLMNCQE